MTPQIPEYHVPTHVLWRSQSCAVAINKVLRHLLLADDVAAPLLLLGRGMSQNPPAANFHCMNNVSFVKYRC